MTDRIKESKLTSTGGIGTPRPGAAGMTKQVTAASEDCKETVREAEPRLAEGCWDEHEQNKKHGKYK